jgi:hypothetical protein
MYVWYLARAATTAAQTRWKAKVTDRGSGGRTTSKRNIPLGYTMQHIKQHELPMLVPENAYHTSWILVIF